MSRLGRAQPIKPHLPGPIIAPGGPVSVITPPRARVHVGWAVARGDVGLDRQRPIKPHLATIVTPGQPIVYPVVRSVVVGQAVQRSTRRPAPIKSHLSSAVVTPAVVTFIAPSLFIVNQGKTRPNAAGRTGHVHHLTGFVIPGQPIVYPIIHSVVVSQAIQRSVKRPAPPKPHVAGAIVAPGKGFIGSKAYIVSQAIQRALKRPGRQVTSAGSLANPVPPVKTAPTIIAQARMRAMRRPGRQVTTAGSLVYNPLPIPPPAVIVRPPSSRTRRTPLPEIVVPGYMVTGPPLAPFPKTIMQAVARTTRRLPLLRAHLAPRTLTQPIAQSPQIARAQVWSQAERRPYVGRQVIRAHVSPPSLFKPTQVVVGTVKLVSQALKRFFRLPFRPRIVPPNFETPFVPLYPPGFITMSISATAYVRMSNAPVTLETVQMLVTAVSIIEMSVTVLANPAMSITQVGGTITMSITLA